MDRQCHVYGCRYVIFIGYLGAGLTFSLLTAESIYGCVWLHSQGVCCTFLFVNNRLTKQADEQQKWDQEDLVPLISNQTLKSTTNKVNENRHAMQS